MDDKFYIYKFIRDDGETLEFDGEEIYLAENNTLLNRPDPNTTAVNYTGADGGEMIRQQVTPYDQTVKGLLIPRTADYWELRKTLSQFFQFNHIYKIVYKKIDGTMFAAGNAWISEGLQITPVPYERYSEWDITFTIGDAVWYEYAEDASGNETYTNTVTLPLVTNDAGGEIWDSVGLVMDSVGEEWEAGSGGVQTVNISSTQAVYPVWVVEGPCTNPTLTNNTTDESATFDGTIASGQTLTVNFADGTAYLNTALATRYMSGVVSLQNGDNNIYFNTDGGDTESCTISWNDAVN